MLKRALILLLIAALLCLTGGEPIHAATTTTPQATIQINAGSLAISGTGSITFAALTLDGDDHSVSPTAAPTFTLTDATGSGAGWNVTLQSTDFSDGGSKSIAASNFTFTNGGGSTIVKVKGQNVDPTNGPKESSLSGAGLDSSRKVITTAVGYGKGKYTYTQVTTNYALLVGADTLAASYTATVTATIASGP